ARRVRRGVGTAGEGRAARRRGAGDGPALLRREAGSGPSRRVRRAGAPPRARPIFHLTLTLAVTYSCGVDAALKAIAEPRRRAILRLVWSDELPASAIAERFPDVSRP